MASRKNDYRSPERLRAEHEESLPRGDPSGGGAPDLSKEACVCGAFGPWGDGQRFYCAAHVPPELRYAGQFFTEMNG